jgi:hypothetical protein
MPRDRAPRLTDHDRYLISQARELTALRSTDAIREAYGETDSDLARSRALGLAKWLLDELTASLERLGGQS